MSSVPKWLDDFMPPRGHCGICGGPDARHRIVDAIRDRYKAGDSVAMLADDYDLAPEVVLRLTARARRAGEGAE